MIESAVRGTSESARAFLDSIDITNLGLGVSSRQLLFSRVDVRSLLTDRSKIGNLQERLESCYRDLFGESFNVTSDIQTLTDFNLYQADPQRISSAVNAVRRFAIAYGYDYTTRFGYGVQKAVVQSHVIARKIYDEIALGGSIIEFNSFIYPLDSTGKDNLETQIVRGPLRRVIFAALFGIPPFRTYDSASQVAIEMEALRRIHFLSAGRRLKLFNCVCRRLDEVIGDMQEQGIHFLEVIRSGLSFTPGLRYTSEQRFVGYLLSEVDEAIYNLAKEFLTLVISARRDESRLELHEIEKLVPFFEAHLAWLKAQTQTEEASIS